MKKSEKLPANESVYEYFCEFAGIRFRLVSDDLFLKEIDFCTGDSFIPDEPPPPSAPIKMILEFMENYFIGNGIEKHSVLFRHNYKDIMVKKTANSAGSIVLDMQGYTDKEIAVYRELVKVKSGTKISYGSLALKSGFPGGARFIGNAMAKNRFPVIIPCHRVIKSDGTTGNFSGGTDIKEKLLRHESGLSFF